MKAVASIVAPTARRTERERRDRRPVGATLPALASRAVARLAAVRRLPLAVAILAFVAAGCGGGEVVSPTPNEVEGPIAAPRGNPTAGKAVYANADPSCGTCHTFTPAGSKAETGPNLDELPELAEKADQGTLAEFTRSSIVDPNAYVEEGFPPVMPSYADTLNEKQLNDLVAFLVQGAK